MTRILVLILVAVLCGCNPFSGRIKESTVLSEPVEVSDEVWKRVQKKIEDRAKANAPKKQGQQLPELEKERPQAPDLGGAPGASTKRK